MAFSNELSLQFSLQFSFQLSYFPSGLDWMEWADAGRGLEYISEPGGMVAKQK